MTTDQFFELYKNAENASFKKSESKVFNGLNKSPVVIYNLAFDYNGGKIKLYFEGVPLPPPGIAAYGGRQVCLLNCSFPSREVADFYIEKRSLIARIFKSKSNTYFKVKTKDSILLNELLSNEHLETIYKVADQSSLSPSISGNFLLTAPCNFKIDVSFGSTVFQSEVLSAAIDFCKSMIDTKGSR